MNNIGNLNNMNRMGNFNNMNNIGNLSNMNGMGNYNNMNNFNNININNVIMNIKNQNNYMLKQIEMNNKILDMIMNNYPHFQNQNNLQSNNNDSNMNEYQKNKKIIKSIFPWSGYTGQRITIVFIYSSLIEYKIFVQTPKIMKVSELLKEFLRSIGRSEETNSINFLFSASKINREDNSTVIEYGFGDCSIIIVLDSHNLFGG